MNWINGFKPPLKRHPKRPPYKTTVKPLGGEDNNGYPGPTDKVVKGLTAQIRPLLKRL
jgi:hypothetical protein